MTTAVTVYLKGSWGEALSATPNELVAGLLARRERLFFLKLAVMLLVGVPLCAMGPIVLASLFWFSIGRVFQVWWSWNSYLAVFTVVSLPLLFRLEYQTQGNYFSQLMQEPSRATGLSLLSPSSSIGNLGALAAWAANPGKTAGGFVELFMYGPRLILGAICRFRMSRSAGRPDRARAIEIVQLLLARDGGLELERILRGGETRESILPTLAWLVYHRWIDVGQKNQRVWLLTESREHIARARN